MGKEGPGLSGPPHLTHPEPGSRRAGPLSYPPGVGRGATATARWSPASGLTAHCPGLCSGGVGEPPGRGRVRERTRSPVRTAPLCGAHVGGASAQRGCPALPFALPELSLLRCETGRGRACLQGDHTPPVGSAGHRAGLPQARVWAAPSPVLALLCGRRPSTPRSLRPRDRPGRGLPVPSPDHRARGPQGSQPLRALRSHTPPPRQASDQNQNLPKTQGDGFQKL